MVDGLHLTYTSWGMRGASDSMGFPSQAHPESSKQTTFDLARIFVKVLSSSTYHFLYLQDITRSSLMTPDPCAVFTTSANTVCANSPSWVAFLVAWILGLRSNVSINSCRQIEFSCRTTGLNTSNNTVTSKTYSNARASSEKTLSAARSVLHPSWDF